MGHTPGTPGFLSRSRLRMKTRKGAAYTDSEGAVWEDS